MDFTGQGLGSIGRNSGQGAKQERFNVQDVCLKNNLITIASGGFGIILKPCNSSGKFTSWKTGCRAS